MSKPFVLRLTLVGLLLAPCALQSCTDTQAGARARRLTEKEAAAMELRLLRAGELGVGDASPSTAATAPALAGARASFVLASTIRGSGQPLPGVRVTLTAVWSLRKYEVVSGEDGVARLEGVIPGRYEVGLAHDSHVPMRGGPGSQRTVELPAPASSCQWAEVYVAGWKAVGSDSLATVGRVRYSDTPSFDKTGEVRQDDFEDMVQRLRARWGDYIHVCLPGPEAPETTTVTIFDEEKGPCRFELPLTPLASFRERTLCDVAGQPAVEPMSRLTIEVVDASGHAVDIGRIAIVRDSDYYGYREDRVFGNRPQIVPPGRYRLSTAGLVWPWQLPDQTVDLVPGKRAVARIRLPLEMREVVLIVPGRGAIARALSGESQGMPIAIHGRRRLWLPKGAVRMSFHFVPEGAHDSVLHLRELTVGATEDLQHITVPLD